MSDTDDRHPLGTIEEYVSDFSITGPLLRRITQR
jgi:hypothetical protein